MAEIGFHYDNGLNKPTEWAHRKSPMNIHFDLHAVDKPVAANVMRRLVRESVQERMRKHLHMDEAAINNVKEVFISPNKPEGYLLFDPKENVINISLDEAQALHGEKIAVVNGGCVDRLGGYIGAELELEKRGIKPDYLIGTSGGSIIAAERAMKENAWEVYEAMMKIPAAKSWQDLIGFDLYGFRYEWKSFNGLISNSKLMKAVQECGVGNATFNKTNIPLGIISEDLDNKDKTLLFADIDRMKDELIFDPEEKETSLFPRNMPLLYPGRGLPIIDAISASTSMPGIFKIKELGNKDNTYSLTDGGVGENVGIRTAASIIDVGKIIAFSMAVSPKNSVPVAHTGIIRAILKAFDAEGDVQTQTLHDYQMYKGLVVREIELTGPETPHAYDRLQDCVANGMHTVRRLLNVLPPDVLFNKLTPTDYHLLYKANLAPTIYQDNMEKSNVAKITDTNPLMQYHVTSPLWQKYYDELGGRIRTKAPKDSTLDWGMRQVMENYGPGWLLFFAFNAWIMKNWFFKNEKPKSRIQEVKESLRAVYHLLKRK